MTDDRTGQDGATRRRATALIAAAVGLGLMGGRAGLAQDQGGDGTAAEEKAPPPRAGQTPGAAPEAEAEAEGPSDAALPPRDPNVGPVTHLPLPRFVSLKTNEGNARRGPGLTHRIDWVFTRAGMPLKVTAEFEHWRRVEDRDGAGGWVHYSLLSGVRSVLVTTDMAEFRDSPAEDASVVYQAEMNVIGKLLACTEGWARVAVEGEKAWARKSDLWGVDPDEVFS